MILKLRPTKRLKFGLVTQACKGCQCVLLSVIANVISRFLSTIYCPYAVFSDKCFFTRISNSNGNDDRSGSVCISCRQLLSTNNGSRCSSYNSGGGGVSGVSLCRSPSRGLQSMILQQQKAITWGQRQCQDCGCAATYIVDNLNSIRRCYDGHSVSEKNVRHRRIRHYAKF